MIFNVIGFFLSYIYIIYLLNSIFFTQFFLLQTITNTYILSCLFNDYYKHKWSAPYDWLIEKDWKIFATVKHLRFILEICHILLLLSYHELSINIIFLTYILFEYNLCYPPPLFFPKTFSLTVTGMNFYYKSLSSQNGLALYSYNLSGLTIVKWATWFLVHT